VGGGVELEVAVNLAVNTPASAGQARRRSLVTC
jgi:hypothetical protein